MPQIRIGIHYYYTEYLVVRFFFARRCRKLRKYMYSCLIFHPQNSARTPFQVGNNIVALIPGKHYNTTNDQIVVIGAHWDTYGLSPGLNDNGSGVASLLEVARVLGNEIFLFVKTSN